MICEPLPATSEKQNKRNLYVESIMERDIAALKWILIGLIRLLSYYIKMNGDSLEIMYRFNELWSV